MRQKNRISRLTTLLAVGLVALATGSAGASDSAWYVEAAFGHTDSEASLGSRNVKRLDGATGATTVALGYSVSRYLGIEAGYHDLGSHAAFGSPCLQTDEVCFERLATLGLCVEGSDCTQVLVDLDADLSGYSFAAIPRWPVSERLSVRGKIGVMAWDSEVRGTSLGDPGFGGSGAVASESFTGEDLLVGIGLEYGFPNGLGLSLGYDELDLDASTASLGVSWRF